MTELKEQINSFLNTEEISKLISLIRNDEELKKIVSSYHGKERGHTLSQQIEDRVKNIIYENFGGEYSDEVSLYKRGTKAGTPRPMKKNLRGKDDCRLRNFFKSPLNIKFSAPSDRVIKNDNGSPNITSLFKLLNRIIEGDVEKYYIVYVMANENDEITVEMFDLLQNVDKWRHDFGPGQIMLNKQDIPYMRKDELFTKKEIVKQINDHLLSDERINEFVERRLETVRDYKNRIAEVLTQ